MEENVHVIRAYAGAFVCAFVCFVLKKTYPSKSKKKSEDRGGQKESCPGACAVVS
jgi:hypothetical protein